MAKHQEKRGAFKLDLKAAMEIFLMLLYFVFRSLRIFKMKCVLLCEVV